MNRPDDICPRPDRPPQPATHPLAAPIYPTSVWVCPDTRTAEQMLAGAEPGYVYQRDGHPNADLLAEKCRELHGADRAVVTSSGMSALALALLSQLEPGQHVVVSRMLYGRSLGLFVQEAARWGIRSSLVDPTCPADVARAMTPATRLVVVETISNPCLVVADLAALADVAHQGQARLLVDNSFASPVLCQPLGCGADLVMESVTKMMNGHSDVILGLLAGRQSVWERVPWLLSTWGMSCSPFDSWLASRGLATLHLRMQRACANALAAARYLVAQSAVAAVDYPGLPEHPQHALASRQFQSQFGSIVTFHLRGGRTAADQFISAAASIPFCPSLGELSTTLSHPESTSHRNLSAEERHSLGIGGGTVRLSVGVESMEFVLESLARGLAGIG
ncbi:MAG: PLP-dependent aspartate aminotransferase family protein [Pirellulaceae bacterium]